MWGETAMGSKFGAELDQSFPLGFRQARAEVCFMRCRDALHLLQETSSFGRQEQLLIPPVLRIALSRNQTFGPQIVEKHHQAAG